MIIQLKRQPSRINYYVWEREKKKCSSVRAFYFIELDYSGFLVKYIQLVNNYNYKNSLITSRFGGNI